MLPITAVITTLNEEENLERCLQSLSDFKEVIVVDSNSQDRTREIAESNKAQVILFEWNGQYPKKRQWCLDHIDFKTPYILFIDADEVVTPAFVDELNTITLDKAGYFIKGQYMWEGTALRHGLKNNKLALFDPRKIEFPEVNDLNIAGMGEMEGHYQPVLKKEFAAEPIGQIEAPIHHYAYQNRDVWDQRHERYAAWEADMIKQGSYPQDPHKTRQLCKQIFRSMPFRALVAFAHCYVLKLGFLDGLKGLDFAKSRYAYYNKVQAKL